MPYSEVSITGYNSNPPEDDGTQVSTNAVTWTKHKTKIGDPLKTAIESTQTNVTAAIAAIETAFAENAKMLFQMTTPPTGWTKDTTHNNKALRLVSGSVSSGGSTPFTDVLKARTIAQANLPSFNLDHSGLSAAITNGSSVVRGALVQAGATGATGNLVTSGSTATLSIAAGQISGNLPSGGSGTAMDFAVQYVDVVIATKDAW